MSARPSDKLIELTMAARHAGADGEVAVRAARTLAAERGVEVDEMAEGLIDRLMAGESLASAVLAIQDGSAGSPPIV